MIKAVIIDDEKHAVEAISILLEQFAQDIQLVGTAHSVARGIALIEKEKPDLVFLDIELNDGLGFEVAEKTAQVGYKLVFTTAYDQYAIRAFKVRALDYLLKPLDMVEFRKSVEDCIREFQAKHGEPTAANRYDTLIKVPESNSYHLVAVADLIFLQADSNYTRIATRQGKSYLVAKTLKEFEARLDPALFARIHNSYLVNRSEVRQLVRGSNCFVTMSDGSSIPVSRARKKMLF